MSAASSTDSVVCVTYASFAGSPTVEPRDVVTDLDEMDAAVALAHRALDLGVAAVADHHDLAAVLAHLGDLDVDLGDQRARRVEHA